MDLCCRALDIHHVCTVANGPGRLCFPLLFAWISNFTFRFCLGTSPINIFYRNRNECDFRFRASITFGHTLINRYLPGLQKHFSKDLVAFVSRVAPRLTENRVPGGGYPEEPSEPELSRPNSRNRGYLYPGCPDTRQLFYTEPPRLGYTLINTWYIRCSCAPRLAPVAPVDYRPRMENNLTCLRTTRYAHTTHDSLVSGSGPTSPRPRIYRPITRSPNLSMFLFAERNVIAAMISNTMIFSWG